VTLKEAESLAALARDADFLGPEAGAWIERLTPLRPNLVDAVAFFTERRDDVAAAELAANVWRLWLISGDIQGGRALVQAALAAPESRPSRERALALYADGLLAFRLGAREESRAANAAALEIARAAGDPEAESLALVGLSRVAFRDGDYTAVRSLALQARKLVQGLDARADVAPLHLLAAGTRLAGDLDAAVELYRESLEANRRLGDRRMVAIELHNIGHVELRRGRADAATRCFAEAETLRNPDDPYDAAMTELNGAALAVVRGDPGSADELLSRAQIRLAAASIVLDPDDAAEVEWLRNRLARAG
jgi:tetratricopeptide (TPR) repeat protein